MTTTFDSQLVQLYESDSKPPFGGVVPYWPCIRRNSVAVTGSSVLALHDFCADMFTLSTIFPALLRG